MSLVISKVFTYDTDAGNYIQAVEAADTVALEPAVRQAINNFVIGCKQDGIWSAIKASCILAGARTLSGALQPLAGTAPTNNNFVSGDYNRKTGLAGSASNTKYLNSNRNNNVEPQNNRSMSIWVSSADTLRNNTRLIACGDSTEGDSYIVAGNNTALNYNFGSSASNVNYYSTTIDTTTGFVGHTRSSSSQMTVRASGASITVNQNSSLPRNQNIGVFGIVTRDNRDSNARLAFYSIGESLDLALLDARVTALITAFGAAIP